MKERVYSGLQFLCKNANNKSVVEILNEYKEQSHILDLLHDNGTLFKTAISHDNSALVSVLLNYMYDTKQINVNPKDNNTDQSIRYIQLQQIIKEAKKEYTFSEEISSVLDNFYKENELNNSYIDYDNLSTHDQEYHELDLAGNSKILEDSEL
jgi:hypothetical protein